MDWNPSRETCHRHRRCDIKTIVKTPAKITTTNIGGMPPLGESGCAGVAARAIIVPTLLREGGMEERVRGERACQGLWPKEYGWNVRVDATHIKMTN